MKIVLHGMLADCFGAEHYIQTNVPAEAIEGLSRQMDGWPRELAVDVIGYTTEEALRSPTDDEVIHLMPSMFGGGGVAKIAIGAVLIVAGIILLPTNPAIGVTLIVNGAVMVLSGIADLLMKAPTSSKANDPPPSKYLGINRNTVNIGTPVIHAWGRIKLAGHWLSLQSDSNQLVTTSFPATTS